MTLVYLILIVLALFLIFETMRHHFLRKTLRFFVFLVFLLLSIFIISSYFSGSNNQNGFLQTGAVIVEFVKTTIN